MKILIFGGTGEARELANELVALGHNVTTSLAGRTRSPRLPQGEVHTGGFGGIAPLVAFIRDEGFAYLVDATHPYAAQMSAHVAAAASETNVLFLRLIRAEWTRPGDADWIEVGNIGDAVQQLPDDALPLFSVGQKEIGSIARWPSRGCVVRLIEPPLEPLPANATLILARPPYSVKDELALMQEHRITHLLTKNSGGDQTRAKIDAAIELGLSIYVIRRPALPDVAREVATVTEALAAIHDVAS